MPKRKATAEQAPNGDGLQLRKRSLDDGEGVTEPDHTPSKRRKRNALEGDNDLVQPIGLNGIEDGNVISTSRSNGNIGREDENQDMKTADETPKTTPRRRGRPPKNRPPGFETPKKAVGLKLSTPQKKAADLSAKKKSGRRLYDNSRIGASDDEHDEDELAREIYDSSEEEQDEEQVLENGIASESATPGEGTQASKTPQRKPRQTRAKSPTPPRDLPPHERYFLQNKPGRPKTSNNNLASLALLTHDEYFSIVRGLKDRHAGDIENLESLHADSFAQWAFELSQGFSLCLYGFGSKKSLIRKFADHLCAQRHGRQGSKIVVVNGYTPTTTIREILSVIGRAVDPNGRIPTSQPTAMVQSIFSQLSSSNTSLTIMINSMDAAPLRKPGTQAILAQLAAHDQVHLICSADTPDFPLLWDTGVRTAFSFVFHDCTTFAPFATELDVVDDVHELLGRTARHVNGREGVAFVLRSLPENGRNLFSLLVGEVLVAMEDDGSTSGEEAGVEYRKLYNKAVEEFICTSEMAFRTLLKEFHDHQIIVSRKDALGTELLSVPFSREELEAILEDLMA